MEQAVILCGGYGTRLGSLSKKIPKPLIPFNGKPFLNNIIFQYSRHQIKNIILLCSYKYNFFKKKYHNKVIYGCKIKCFIEKKPSGTAGALRRVKKNLDKVFFLSNGDTLANFNILSLKKNLDRKSLISVAVLKKNNSNNRYGGVKLMKNNNIKFESKKTNLINTGYYLIKKKLIRKIKKEDYNFEKDVLRKLSQTSIKGLILKKKHNYFLDMGMPGDLKKTASFLKKFNFKKAVFLDRDGVVNKDSGYVHKHSQINYINNIKKTIKLLNDNNFYVFVITNQSGVGRGYYSSKAVDLLHKKINDDLIKQFGHVDEFVFAPYYKYSKMKFTNKDKLMRKPNTGMIDYLFNKWKIIKKESCIIGDSENDKKLASNCNINYFDVSKEIDLYLLLKKKLGLKNNSKFF